MYVREVIRGDDVIMVLDDDDGDEWWCTMGGNVGKSIIHTFPKCATKLQHQ